MARRFPLAALAAAALIFTISAGPTLACGGLIGPNGAVNLLRTTTLAAYHDGIEHYVTAFQFAGGGGAFGSIVPLPGVPTDVVRGGDWTLQRLVRETQPVLRDAFAGAAAAEAPGVQVLLQTRIDALDITVLKGGAAAVGQWAGAHGFRLPPDAPEVLDFYAKRSPIFMAAVFDADAAKARGQAIGDGTPVHITIPTTNPWVPLRILALGRTQAERVDADVYLLTDRAPAMLPAPGDGSNGLVLSHFAPASDQLLADLRADKGMEWMPDTAWLTQVHIDAAAPDLRFDLAIDASGRGAPSRVAAGLDPETWPLPDRDSPIWPLLAVVLVAVGASFSLVELNRRSLPPTAAA
jgi:hypothetical protein